MTVAVTDCVCFESLCSEVTNGDITGRFIDTGNLINLANGETRRVPLLRFLKETNTGRQTVYHRLWWEVKFCPECGAKVRYEPVKEAGEGG